MTQILPQATVHQLNCSCLGAVDGGCNAGQHSHIVVPIQIADAIIFLSYITLHYRQPKLFKSRISVERKFCFIMWTHFKWQHGKNITLPVKRILHCFLENIHQNPPSLSLSSGNHSDYTSSTIWGDYSLIVDIGTFPCSGGAGMQYFPTHTQKILFQN